MSVSLALEKPESPADKTVDGPPIRVLFYLFFPGAGSGVGRYTHELLTCMNHCKDVSVELACSPSCHWMKLAEYRTWPGLCELSHSNRWLRKMRFLYAQLGSPLRVLKHASQTQADIIHFANLNQISFPIWSHFLSRTKAKIAVTVHDVFRQKGLVSPRYDNSQLTAFYRRADALFVHGNGQRDLLVGAGVDRSRISIVPHGLCDSGKPTAGRLEIRKRYGLPADKQVALFFGAIRDDKNVELLIRAIADTRDRLHLMIAGQVSHAHRMTVADYRNLIERLGVSSSVTFDPRFIPDNEIPDLMAASDWVALTYSGTFTSQSGVLNVAAQYEKPVLVSDIGCLGETCRDAKIGVAVRPDDLEDLKRGMRQMVDKINTPGSFNFDDYRLRYSWQENVNTTLNVYRRLLGR